MTQMEKNSSKNIIQKDNRWRYYPIIILGYIRILGHFCSISIVAYIH